MIPPEMQRDLRITLHPRRHRLIRALQGLALGIAAGGGSELLPINGGPHSFSDVLVPILSGAIAFTVLGEQMGRIEIKQATRRLNNR